MNKECGYQYTCDRCGKTEFFKDGEEFSSKVSEGWILAVRIPNYTHSIDLCTHSLGSTMSISAIIKRRYGMDVVYDD